MEEFGGIGMWSHQGLTEKMAGSRSKTVGSGAILPHATQPMVQCRTCLAGTGGLQEVGGACGNNGDSSS